MERRQFLAWSLGAIGGASVLPRLAIGQSAQSLTIGVSGAPASLDPHFQDSFINNQANQQFFSALLFSHSSGKSEPDLATDFTALDPVTWEVKLRQGVTFHDGTPLSAEDVVFSYARVPNVPGAASPFTANVKSIKEIEIVDPETIRFHLNKPDPLFSWRMTQVAILSRTIHKDAVPADFNSGKAVVGTGPYRLAGYAPGEKMEITAVPGHWYGEQAFANVMIRYISDPGARIAALRSGDVDLIDAVSALDADNLADSEDFRIFETAAFVTIYLFPDAAREQTPSITDNDGKPLDKNPLLDAKVREAISLSIDRNAFVTRLMSGKGTVADQMVAPGSPDRNPNMPALAYDVAKARNLLTEAGYPDGFKMIIDGTNGLYYNDSNILQAIGQSLGRIGITAEVQVAPASVFIAKANEREMSMFLLYFATVFNSNALQYLAMTRDAENGYGSSNRMHYSNPAVDKLVIEALNEVDVEKNHALLAEAIKIVIDEKGLIPIMHTNAIWAGRKDKLIYEANPKQHTTAFYAKTPA